MAYVRTRDGARGSSHQVIWWDRKVKKQRSETFTELREAKRRLKVIEGLIASGDAPEIPDKLTYGSFYEVWIEQDVPKRLTPKVQGGYISTHKALILPFWQHRTPASINVDTITEWVTWMDTKTKSYHCKDQAWVSMSSCLSYAVFRQKLDRHPIGI